MQLIFCWLRQQLSGLLFCFVIVSFSTLCNPLQAQYTITGKITDAQTGDPIPFASIALKGTTIGVSTSFEGFYTIKAKKLTDSLIITSVGYTIKTKSIDPTQTTQTINIQLVPSVTQLIEVVVSAGENPAFAILRRVRENRFRNDPKRLAAYQYESYSKIEVDVDNLSEKFKKRKVVKKITKVIDEFDKLAGEDGQPVLPMFLSESISDVYYINSPQRKKEYIRKTKVSGVGVKDGSFVSQLIGNSFQNYNFYESYVNIVQKDFASPIGENWKGVYKYFLADSLWMDSVFCYEIEFEPKVAQDLAFTGKMWIDKKTNALYPIDATIGKQANLNYIEKIKIQQEMQPTAEGAWLPAKIRTTFDIAEVSKNSAGMLAKLYVSNRNMVVNQPKPLSFYDLPVEMAEDFADHTPQYWDEARHDSLSAEDQQALAMIDSVRDIPVVRTYVQIVDLAVNGWKKVGILDIGPYLSMIAYNPVEGVRTRVGFRTNTDFSKRWILRGYIGYGFSDHKLKYAGEINHILSRRRWTVIGMSHSFDIERVGITQEIIGNNKLFYAFTRFGSRGSFYQTENKVFVKSEPIKGIILSAAFVGSHFNPVGLPYYNFGYYPVNGDTHLRHEFQDNRIELELRVAKNETYVMDGNERITLGTKRTPVLTFRYTKGLKGFLGGDFSYDKFSASAFQTLRVGQFGRSNYRLSVGYTPSRLPYPLLFTHLGGGGVRNLLYNRFSYNMMGFFEFVSDQYASLMWDHNFEGWLFNRIPGIQKLRWRLVASANILYGGQRSENKNVVPATDPDENRILEFGRLRPSVPYVEVGYGIDNIFRVLRIQAFHRLTYLNHPHVHPFGVKASVHFHF
ncbi:DUF5686 and carboxypeptidase-like regulatory domain-containing protein [Xanthocytophaga agilis]|uniref:DUF5686 family protein n=1 Tax=Xanthocytophaga agilis TaxID=3048010 RepID=A0AAE3UDQ0_9BACT|nr:DUF5686 family protein [Xanthocytophaga agilis]MDJ1502093.1 DUF5686 family protein [Xanthocytophaga agilis]